MTAEEKMLKMEALLRHIRSWLEELRKTKGLGGANLSCVLLISAIDKTLE